MKKLTVEDLAFRGKRVLMRVDFNVPLEDGKLQRITPEQQCGVDPAFRSH